MQGITEISGEAGSGKTQLCLSIAVQVKLLTWPEEFSDFPVCCSQFWIEEKNLLSTMLQYYHVEKGYFQLSDYPNLL